MLEILELELYRRNIIEKNYEAWVLYDSRGRENVDLRAL